MEIFNISVSIRRLIPPFIYDFLKLYHEQKPFISEKLHSYSQYNEDLFIDAILKCGRIGFYVDIGANNPSVFNNTKRFYDRGWRGINIEPNPALFSAFLRDRPEDVNLNIGIGDRGGTLPFYVMSADTLSSFDRDAALSGGKTHKAKLERVIDVEVRPLRDVLERYIDRGIDFLSVDTEGYDLLVIQSNDWSRWRPKVIVIETNRDDGSVKEYLVDKGYELILDNLTNAIYVDTEYMRSI